MITIGEKVATPAAEGHEEKKGIKQFYKASDLKPGQVIEGILKGTFESKKTAGYHFHIFEDKAGDVYAYGECIALKDNISAIKAATEMSPVMLYATFNYEGKFPNKKDPKKTTHRFSKVELFKTTLPKVTGNVAITATDVPF